MLRFERLTHTEKMACLLQHIAESDCFGYPTPLPWVIWVLEQYDQAIPAIEGSPVPLQSVPFSELSDAEKLAKIREAVSNGKLDDNPATTTIPTPWVVWLLDKLQAV